LQADEDYCLEDFGFLSSDEFEAAVDGVVSDGGTACTSPERSKLRRLHFRAGQLSREAPPAPKAVAETAPKVKAKLPKKRKFEEILEQGAADATFEVMSKEQVNNVRDNYELGSGAAPPENCRPTPDQISALKSRIDDDEAPFADFGIFGNVGKKAANMRRFEVRKMVGDELVTKYVSGPGNHEEWLDSWRVYRTTLIALGAVSAGSLDLYQEGVRRLTHLYPAAWGDILLAEEEMKFEHWGRMQEMLTASPAPKYESDRPWDFIVAQSAFTLGTGSMCYGWWQEHLVAGLNSPQSTQKIIAGLIGRAPRAAPASSSRSAPAPGSPKNLADTSSKACRKWNKGVCSSTGPCPDGYAHTCSKCGLPGHGAHKCKAGLVRPVGGGGGPKDKKSRK
jgi:hypothetical protein